MDYNSNFPSCYTYVHYSFSNMQSHRISRDYANRPGLPSHTVHPNFCSKYSMQSYRISRDYTHHPGLPSHTVHLYVNCLRILGLQEWRKKTRTHSPMGFPFSDSAVKGTPRTHHSQTLHCKTKRHVLQHNALKKNSTP